MSRAAAHLTRSAVLQGVLGFGAGKAGEVAVAIRKADLAALKSLFFVPRYAGSTVHQLRKVKYGEQPLCLRP